MFRIMDVITQLEPTYSLLDENTLTCHYAYMWYVVR